MSGGTGLISRVTVARAGSLLAQLPAAVASRTRSTGGQATVNGALRVLAGAALGRECGPPVPDRRDGLVPGG